MNRYTLLRFTVLHQAQAGGQTARRWLTEPEPTDLLFEFYGQAIDQAKLLNAQDENSFYSVRGLEYTCASCGQTTRYNIDELNPEYVHLVYRQGMCNDCAIWTVHLRRLTDPNVFVTPDYEMFYIKEYTAPDAPPRSGSERGYHGCKFEIQRIPSCEIVYSDNLWALGAIPTHLRAGISFTGAILRKNVGVVRPASVPANQSFAHSDIA